MFILSVFDCSTRWSRKTWLCKTRPAVTICGSDPQYSFFVYLLMGPPLARTLVNTILPEHKLHKWSTYVTGMLKQLFVRDENQYIYSCIMIIVVFCGSLVLSSGTAALSSSVSAGGRPGRKGEVFKKGRRAAIQAPPNWGTATNNATDQWNTIMLHSYNDDSVSSLQEISVCYSFFFYLPLVPSDNNRTF